MSKKILLILLILGIVGFADAAYLTATHYGGTSLVCSVFNGCDKVTSSVYAAWGGIPVALVGMFYYAAIVIVAGLAVWKDKKYVLWIVGVSALGLFASIWFVYLQAFVLHAFCTYCLISAAVTFTIFVMSVKALRLRSNEGGA